MQGEGERLRDKIRHLERNLQASHQVQVHACYYTVTGVTVCLFLYLIPQDVQSQGLLLSTLSTEACNACDKKVTVQKSQN